MIQQFRGLLFFISINIIIKKSLPKCIGIDDIKPNFCSFCSRYYFKETYNETDSKPKNEYFPLSECLPKEKPLDENLEIEYYVSNKECEEKPCSGSKENPFPNLISG